MREIKKSQLANTKKICHLSKLSERVEAKFLAVIINKSVCLRAYGTHFVVLWVYKLTTHVTSEKPSSLSDYTVCSSAELVCFPCVCELARTEGIEPKFTISDQKQVNILKQHNHSQMKGSNELST